MVEAAVHYYRATGKTRLLQVATRLANHMADVMGPPPKRTSCRAIRWARRPW